MLGEVGNSERAGSRIQLPVIRLLLVALIVLVAPSARALTNNSSNSTSLGVSGGKTNVFVSSYVFSSSIGQTMVLSSHTVTAGKTFYLQHFDASANLKNPLSTTFSNLGSIALFTTGAGGVIIASMTLSGQTQSPIWNITIPEPIPFSAGSVIASSVTAQTGANNAIFNTNMMGYEK